MAESRGSGDASWPEVASAGGVMVLAGAIVEESPYIRKSSEDGMEVAENGNMDS